jgi:adenosylmethionine-8-amino-7-oxononanoate aminotransferase
LEEIILREGPEQVSALIAEPVIGGTAPAVAPPPGYWTRVQEILERYEVLLIMDEVLTGFGRTGRQFAMQHFGITPDLATCAKGLTSGYAPLGAVVVSKRVADAFRQGSGKLRHSFTYSGHAIGCAAGLAAVRYLNANDLSSRAARLGDHLLDALEARLESHPRVAEVRGLGLLVGIEFESTRGHAATSGTRFCDRVVSVARRERVILTPATNGDQLQLIPPMLTEPEELVAIADAVVRSIDIAEREV